MSPTEHLERMNRARLIDKARRAETAAMRHRAEAEAAHAALARVSPDTRRADLDVLIGPLAELLNPKAA